LGFFPSLSGFGFLGSRGAVMLPAARASRETMGDGS
jgi:hypothetical protein